jgi:hypothetical protein
MTRTGWGWAEALLIAALCGGSLCARAQKAEANVTGTIAFDTSQPLTLRHRFEPALCLPLSRHPWGP